MDPLIDQPNCIFQEMSWSSGLSNHIRKCSLVLVPTLWSSPIEGALIKSLSYARETAVVQNETSFSDELPDNIVLKLDTEPEIAVAQVLSALKEQSTVQENDKREFINIFERTNKKLLTRLISLIMKQ